MIRRASVLLVLALGCGGREAYTRSSERVAAPAGSPWTAAQASIRFEPYRYGAHASQSEHVVLGLELEGSPSRTLELDDAYLGDRPGDTPKDEYEQLLEPAFDLRFAPDGHALAISIDGGRTFRPVLFDLGEPVFCQHESIAADALWDGFPASRRIVLDVLASAEPPIGDGRLHLVPGESPRARERFVRELNAARSFACARPDDAELRDALLGALVRPGMQIFATADYLPLAECVGTIAREHADMVAALAAAIDRGAGEQRLRAAIALGQGADEATQEALVVAIIALPAACPSSPAPAPAQKVECDERRHLRNAIGWALGAVSTRRGTVSAAALAGALALSREAESAVQIFAIRTLALSDDPTARARVAELAAGDCAAPVSWRSEWLSVYDEVARFESPACWAAAALRR